MSNYAVVENGVVVNIIVLDDVDDWTAPSGATVVQIQSGIFVDIGYLYDGTNFTPPVIAANGS